MTFPFELHHIGEHLVARLLSDREVNVTFFEWLASGHWTTTARKLRCASTPTVEAKLDEIAAGQLHACVSAIYSSKAPGVVVPKRFTFDGECKVDVVTHDGRDATPWEVKLGRSFLTASAFERAFLTGSSTFKANSKNAAKPTSVIAGNVPTILRDYRNVSGVFGSGAQLPPLTCNGGSLSLSSTPGFVVRSTLASSIFDAFSTQHHPAPSTNAWPTAFFAMDFDEVSRSIGKPDFDDAVWEVLGLQRVSFFDQWLG